MFEFSLNRFRGRDEGFSRLAGRRIQTLVCRVPCVELLRKEKTVTHEGRLAVLRIYVEDYSTVGAGVAPGAFLARPTVMPGVSYVLRMYLPTSSHLLPPPPTQLP